MGRSKPLNFIDGDNQSIGSQASQAQGWEVERPGATGLSTATRCVHSCVYHHSKEAEFGDA